MPGNKYAQTILEYVILLAIVIAAIVILGYYLRNSFSGKFREAADVFGQGEVYEPFGRTHVEESVR
jgi:uncharacterized protein (UPF0333 family)